MGGHAWLCDSLTLKSNKMKFTIDDIKYKEGFPANIQMDKPIIVQVIKPRQQSCVLYYCYITGHLSRCYLPLEIGENFDEGIYTFNLA